MSPRTESTPAVPPSGAGCVECDADGGWWFHLRRCAQCGHIGCCDDSPAKHATAHVRATGHPVIRSFEPGESWFWNYETSEMSDRGPAPGSPREPPGRSAHPRPRGTSPGGLGRPTGLGSLYLAVPSLSMPAASIAATGRPPPRFAVSYRSWRCRCGCQRASRSTAEAMAWKPASLGCRPSLKT